MRNSGFEQGALNWKLFIPRESASAGCRFSVEDADAHSSKLAAHLSSAQTARFGIYYTQPTPIVVKPGQHYRLTAWVKAGKDFAAASDSAGPVLRATLLDKQMKDVQAGHIFVDLQGIQRGEPLPLGEKTVPTEWTKIEETIEIPFEATTLTLFVFCWKTSGSLWVDDVSMVEISPKSS